MLLAMAATVKLPSTHKTSSKLFCNNYKLCFLLTGIHEAKYFKALPFGLFISVS